MKRNVRIKKILSYEELPLALPWLWSRVSICSFLDPALLENPENSRLFVYSLDMRKINSSTHFQRYLGNAGLLPPQQKRSVIYVSLPIHYLVFLVFFSIAVHNNYLPSLQKRLSQKIWLLQKSHNNMSCGY